MKTPGAIYPPVEPNPTHRCDAMNPCSVEVLVQAKSLHGDGADQISVGRFFYGTGEWSVDGFSSPYVRRWWPLPNLNEGGHAV